MFIKKIILVSTIFIFGLTYSQSVQDELRTAKELWTQGKCKQAMVHMDKVRTRLNDFPDNARSQIEKSFLEWSGILQNSSKLKHMLKEAIPPIADTTGKTIPLAKLQTVRDSLNKLLSLSNSIQCLDIQDEIQTKIIITMDSTNLVMDKYIDDIISDNEGLRTAIDSLTKLARRYKRLLPVLDSLRAIIARQSGNIRALQAQVDTILLMASQTANISGGDEFSAISSPTDQIANALLDGVENRIISLGEGKVRRKDYTDEQSDSLLGEFTAIASWLDTSLVAKNSPTRAKALRELCFNYTDLIFSHNKSNNLIRWVALILLAIIVIAAIVFALKRKKK
ncbi:hypothetical protein J7L68_04065 [bacterium]|nr:hypothetical protein [bacterium]